MYLGKTFNLKRRKMNTKNALLVLAGLMLAWAGAASAEMTMTWAGERQGVAKAAVAGDAESADATDVVAAEEDEEEESSITREEYLATVAYVEGEAAVDELSRRMVEDMFGPSDDGEGSQYGDSTLPGGDDDGVLPGGVKLTRSVGAAPRTAGSFSAEDNAGNYTSGDWGLQTGKGSGFLDWQEKTTGDATVTRTLEGGDFTMQAGENPGEIVMLRPLDTQLGLVSGDFSTGLQGTADEPGDFVGFAVYGSADGAPGSELIRWGFMTVENGPEADDPYSSWTAYSLDGGETFRMVKSGEASGAVQFTLTWAQLAGGGLGFTLNSSNYGIVDFNDNGNMQVLGADRVMAIAAVLTESGMNSEGFNGTEMNFNHLEVNGVEATPAVPEPGTLGLLAAGLVALWRRKAKREK